MPKPLCLKIVTMFVLCSLHSQSVCAEQIINVAIASSSQALSVQGRDIKLYGAGDKLIATQDRYQVTLKSRQLYVDGKALDTPLRLLSANTVIVSGKKFRGEIDIVVDQVNNNSVITFVHPLPLETYVAGIVASEIPTSWPLEALKAQAIAARTYAVWQKYRRIEKSYHLDSSVLDQVYGGLDKEHARAEQAAQETLGLVLTYDAKPSQAYFHSSCGGETASSEEGWGFSIPYLPGSECGYCDIKNRSHWQFRVSKGNFEKAVSDYKVKGVTNARVGTHSDSGRVKKIEFSFGNKKRELTIAELRKRLGYNNLRSALVDRVDVTSKDLIFYGRGHGHGVGMCQWGANGMAKAGFIASEILARYYPGSELRRLY